MSQRERLRGRRLPPAQVQLRVDFSPDADLAYSNLEAAKRALQAAEARGDELEAAVAHLAAAREAVSPHAEVLTISTLSADMYEALLGEHPPTEESRAKGAQWDAKTFVPALLAACIGVDDPDPMTIDDWAEFASTPNKAAVGELNALFNACLVANYRTVDEHVGKGSGVGTTS